MHSDKRKRTPAEKVFDRVMARHAAAEHALAYFPDVPSNKEIRVALLKYAKTQRMMLAIAEADLQVVTDEVEELCVTMLTWQPEDSA